MGTFYYTQLKDSRQAYANDNRGNDTRQLFIPDSGSRNHTGIGHDMEKAKMKIRDITKLENECANLSKEIDVAIGIAAETGADKISITLNQAERIQKIAKGYGKYLAMISNQEVEVYS